MFKKFAAIACIVATFLTQAAFADYDEIMLISSYQSEAKTEFYSLYGERNAADVFYNGEYIAFEDVQPLVISGTTFVPIRAFCDTIGAEISFVDETFEVIIENGNDKISFIAGSKDIYVNGELTTLPAETFMISSRTMVPARLISEAFDLLVTWNGTHQQVSIVDVNSLKEGIDTDYSLVNSALAMTTTEENGKNTAFSGDLSAKIGEMGSENTINMIFEAIANSDSSIVDFSAECSLDTASLEQELEIARQSGLLDQATEQILTEYIEILSDFDLNFVFDTENMEIYLWSENMDTVGKLLLSQDGISQDDVAKIEYAEILDDSDFAEMQGKILTAISGEHEYTVENLIDNKLAQSQYTDLFETNIYAQAYAMSQGLKDELFSKKLTTYTLSNSISIDNAQVDYEIELKVNANEQVASYYFNYVYVDNSNGDVLLASISQDSVDEISYLLNQKKLEGETYQTLALNCSLKRSDTTKSPTGIPTENVLEILN